MFWRAPIQGVKDPTTAEFADIVVISKAGSLVQLIR